MQSEPRPWSLVSDLKWQQLGLLAVLWLAGAVVATFVIVHETDEMFDNAMIEAANAVLAVDTHAELRDTSQTAEQLALAGDRKKYMSFQVRDADGHVIFRSSNAPAEAYPVPLKPGFVSEGRTRYLTRPAASTGHVVQIAEYYDERRDALLGLIAGFMVPLLALLGLGGVLVSRNVGRAAKPIQDLGRQLQARSGADMRLVETAGMPIELQPIVEDVNRLLARLTDAFEAERAFAANCAHELRNPIAAARAQLEYVALFPDDQDNRRRLAATGTSLAQLGHRIERLLQLSRAESGAGGGTTSADLVAITHLLVDDHIRRGSPIDFVAGRPALDVAIDKDALGIAIQNVIDNAVTHADAGSRVEVCVAGTGALHVVNACIPLSADGLAHLQKRSYRDRTAKLGGYGLGLAIVGEIMRHAGGTLELKSPATGRSDGFEAIMAVPPVSAPEFSEADAKMTTAGQKVAPPHQTRAANPMPT